MPNRYQQMKFRTITKQYGLNLIRIKTYDSLYKKNAVYCATTNQGKYLVKALNTRSLGMRMPKEQYFSYIRKLKSANYPYAPQWRRAGGRYSVVWHGKSYYITEWITGRGIMKDVQDYESLGRALARLHSIRGVQHTPAPLYTQQRLNTFKLHSHRFHHHLITVQKKKSSSSKWFEKHGDSCVHLTNEAWAILNDPQVKHIISRERRHPTLTHGDVTIPNIVIHPRGLVLIDWDCLRPGSMYYEIAKTLANTTHYKPFLIDAFLQGYEANRPLRSSERLLISALFRLPREAWNAASKIAVGRSPRGLSLLVETWNDRLNAIHHLDDWARR